MAVEVVPEPAKISREASLIRSAVLKREAPVVLCERKMQRTTSDLVQVGPSVMPIIGTAKGIFIKAFIMIILLILQEREAHAEGGLLVYRLRNI